MVDPTALPFALRLALLLPTCLLAADILWSSCRLKPGLPRAVAALPALTLFAAAPLLFRRVDQPPSSDGTACNDIVTLVLVEFSLTSLATLKAAAWVLGRGPLVRDWSRRQFAALLLLPLTPVDDREGRRHGRQAEAAGGPAQLALAFLGKLAVLLVGVSVLKLGPPPLLADFLYSLGLYSILSFVMDGPGALLSWLTGIEISPHFDQPFGSRSIHEFWSRRWDLTVGNALRWAVYEPVLEGRLIKSPTTSPTPPAPAPAAPPPHSTAALAGPSHGRGAAPEPATASAQAQPLSARRRLAATAATFVGSGLLHEVMWVYLTGRPTGSGGLLMLFFLAQVPLLLAERWLAAQTRRLGWRPPAAVCTVCTIFVLLTLAHYTFWRAAHVFGLTQAALANILSAFGLLDSRACV